MADVENAQLLFAIPAIIFKLLQSAEVADTQNVLKRRRATQHVCGRAFLREATITRARARAGARVSSASADYGRSASAPPEEKEKGASIFRRFNAR